MEEAGGRGAVPGGSVSQVRELPDMMSASEGGGPGGGHGKADLVRTVK